MNWKTLFVPGANLSPEEAKHFMDSRAGDSYQILDVRQPKEYEQGHLPGALLIPVKEVVARKAELDPEKPVLVYCHSGVRSKAASQLLLAEGFPEVYNMSGGIVAWKGGKVGGGEEQGMEFFLSRDFADVFQMAYAMEEALRQLYLGLGERARKKEDQELMKRLAAFEDGHKARIAAMFAPSGFVPAAESNVVEGGFDRLQILEHFGPQIGSAQEILQLGMALEAQALDLYTRLARRLDSDEKSRELFAFLATEEGQHLAYLSRELDALLR